MAVKDGIYFKIDPLSIKKLEYSFQALGSTAVKKIMRKQASRAMKPMLHAARAGVPKRSGLLRKSLGVKVKAYAMAVWAGMGPRHGFRGIITDPRTGRQIIADPVKYAHLVELGTAPHGKHPGSPPQAFMRKAFEAHRQSAVRAFADGVVKDIEAAWAKILGAQGAAA